MNNFQSLNKMFGRNYFGFLLACFSTVTMSLGTLPARAGLAGGAGCAPLGNPNDGAINSDCSPGRQAPMLVNTSVANTSGAAQSCQSLHQQAVSAYQGFLATCEKTYEDCKATCGREFAQNPNNVQAKANLENCEARYKEGASYYHNEIATNTAAVQSCTVTGGTVAEKPAEDDKDRGVGAWIGKIAVGGIIATGVVCLLGFGACGDDDGDDDGVDCKLAKNAKNPKCVDDDEDDDDVNCNLASNANHADCVVDCKLPKYMKHPNCIPDVVDNCTTNPKLEGCDDFEEEYCGPYKDPGIAPTAVKSIKGEGVGTVFCDLRIAKKFCEPSARKSSCPTCINLDKLASDSCKSNPSMCLPQMTDEDKNKAKVVCPIDPVFSNPDFLAGKNKASSVASVNNSGSITTASVSSKNASSWKGKKVSEIRGRIDASQARINRRVASEKVAHDIELTSGQNLFNSQRRIFAQRCRAGLVNNCGPRQFNRANQ